MTQTTKNVLIAMAFIGTLATGATGSRLLAQTPTVIDIKGLMPPCVCECVIDLDCVEVISMNCIDDALPSLPAPAVVTPPEVKLEIVPAVIYADPYRHYLELTASPDFDLVNATYRLPYSWRRWSPVVGLNWTEVEPSSYRGWSDSGPSGGEWSLLVGVRVGIW